MKKQLILVLAAILFTVSVGFSQFRKIPVVVTEAFKAKFPSAKNVSWTDKVTAFQASFEQDEIKLQASFDIKGDWKKTEQNLTIEDLPGVITQEMKDNRYAGYTVKTVTQIVDSEDKMEYRILIEKSALKKKVLYMNKEGEVLREAITL